MDARFTVSGSQIAVFTKMQHRDRCKSVMGYDWRPSISAWVYPAGPTTAVALNRAFSGLDVSMDSNFVALLYHGTKAIEESASIKTDENLPMPPLYRHDRRPWLHQLRAFWFCHKLWGDFENPHGGGAMLALQMGTGKTFCAITLIANYRFRRVLVIAPAKVVPVWPEEFFKSDPGQSRVLALGEGSVAKRAAKAKDHLEKCAALYPNDPAVVVTNYECARETALAVFSLNVQWDLVVADEIHRIKQPSGLTSKYMGLLGRMARCRLGLTGTPMPHSWLDVFGQYRFLDPSIFGLSWHRFRMQYAVMGGYGNHEVVGFKNEKELSRKFYSIAYRVLSREVLDLPEQTFIIRTAELDKGAKIYRDMHRYMVAEVRGGTVTASNALTRLLRLQQITGGYLKDEDGTLHQVDGSKAALLADVLGDLDPHEPVVIFCHFHPDIDACKRVATELGRAVSELSGRVNELNAWQRGETDILVAQIQSGKEGVDMSRSAYTIYYSLGFSLADYEQSLFRTHRPGQRRNTTYIHLALENTVDMAVYKALQERKEVIGYVLDQLKT